MSGWKGFKEKYKQQYYGNDEMKPKVRSNAQIWSEFQEKYKQRYCEPSETQNEEKDEVDENCNSNKGISSKTIIASIILTACIIFIILLVQKQVESTEDSHTALLIIAFIAVPTAIYIVEPSSFNHTKQYIHYNPNMTGIQYEYYVANRLEKMGYINVIVTKGSGDHGADILATSPRGKTCAIQCKHYAGKVGNKAVQEAYSAAGYYGCREAIVITNSVFTKQAIQDANRLGVKLIQRF